MLPLRNRKNKSSKNAAHAALQTLDISTSHANGCVIRKDFVIHPADQPASRFHFLVVNF